MRIAVALLLVLAPVQDPAFKVLVEELRSEDLEVREQAFRKLVKLGDSIEADLKVLAKDSDGEVAARAKKLLHLIETRRLLPANLRSLYPGIEERLAFGESHLWITVFHEVAGCQNSRWARLKREDLEALAGPALKHADPDVGDILEAIYKFRLRGAAPAILALKSPPPQGPLSDLIQALDMKDRAIPWLVGFLGHSDALVRSRAIELLDHLLAETAGPKIIPLLKDPVAHVRESAADFFWTNPCADAVPELLKTLDDPNPMVQWYSMQALADCAPKESLPVILKMAKNSNADTRENVAGVLSKFPAERAMETVLQLLKDDKGDVREDAVETMGMWRRVEAFDAVSALLRDKHENARSEAASALIRIDRERALPILREHLKDLDPDIVAMAARTLAYADDHVSAKTIAGLVGDERPGVRTAALEALVRLNAVEVVPDLAARWETSKGDEYSRLLSALERFKNPACLPVLLRVLETQDEKRVIDALRLLGESKALEAKSKVFERLDHEEGKVRFAAARAANHLGDKGAVPGLRKLLRDDDITLRWVAIESLGSLRAVEASEDLLPFLKLDRSYWGYNVTRAAIKSLGQMKRKEAILALTPLLENRLIRTEVFLALAEINDPSGYGAMAELLNDLEHENRLLAVKTFGQIRAASLVPTIARILKDSNDDLRYEAVNALGWIGASSAPAAMIEALGDPSGRCRNGAVNWLKRLGHKEAIPHLAKLLDHADHDLRGRAADAMAWLGSRDGTKVALEQGNYMTGLNMLRTPEVFRRLQEIRAKVSLNGTSTEFADRIGTAAGMRVRLTRPFKTEEVRWDDRGWAYADESEERSLLEWLSVLVQGSPYAVVIERDEIRIIPRAEAVEFWKSWLKETK